MVFITRRWAKNRKYGPYYYMGWTEAGKIKWKYLGKAEAHSSKTIEALEEARTRLQKKAKRIDELISRLKESKQNE